MTTVTGLERDRHRRLRAMVIATVPITVEAFLVEQIQALEGNGLNVTVVCSPGPGIERLRQQGLHCNPIVIPRAMRPLKLLLALINIARLMLKTRPDVIHTHTPVAAFLGQLAAWAMRVPVRITTVHGLVFTIEPRPLIRRLYHTLEVMACRWATRVICVSGEDARHLVNDCSFAPRKIEVMNVGVRLDIYDPQRVTGETRQSVRREFDIPADAFVFGMVSRMTGEKGMLELLEAFSKIVARDQHVYFLHVGPIEDSRDDAVTPQDAERFGCASRCRFAGQRYDVWRMLGAMDVFCLPSYREGYPVSLMESAAMGLPAIATDIRGCREAVVNGVTGLLVRPRDARELERAMERLLLDPAERQAIAHAARQRALEQFDRRLVVEKTVELYRSEVCRRLGKCDARI